MTLTKHFIDRMVDQSAKVVNLPHPPSTNYRAMRCFLSNERPLTRDDEKPFWMKSDFRSLYKGQDTNFRIYIERLIWTLFPKWITVWPILQGKCSEIDFDRTCFQHPNNVIPTTNTEDIVYVTVSEWTSLPRRSLLSWERGSLSSCIASLESSLSRIGKNTALCWSQYPLLDSLLYGSTVLPRSNCFSWLLYTDTGSLPFVCRSEVDSYRSFLSRIEAKVGCLFRSEA